MGENNSECTVLVHGMKVGWLDKPNKRKALVMYNVYTLSVGAGSMHSTANHKHSHCQQPVT